MKCTSCGLPLSPSRTVTNCPRCGTPTDATSARYHYQQANWGSEEVVDAGTGASPLHYQWAQNVQNSPMYFPPSQSPHSDRVWQSGQAPPSESLLAQTSHASPPLPGHHNTKPGFIVAGLCILAGGLILIFVYFLAIGSTANNSSDLTTATSTSNVSLKIPTSAPTVASTLSPTATTYPGEHNIDSAQMSSSVDANSLQPTQLTTTFTAGQKMYVTFQVHPAGRTGAVCLDWYLNSKLITVFSLPVSALSKYSYAYSIYGGTGAAYVDLYWASTTQCTDQVLAQHVIFTVTN